MESCCHYLNRNLRDYIPISILVQVNIDGIPIAKRSNSQLLPINGLVPKVEKDVVFLIVYHGNQKPVDSN